MATKLKKLDEQVIVITGASSGIGLATAEAAAKRGAKVVLTARSGHTLDQIVTRLNAAGGETMAVTADVSDRAQVQQVAEAAVGRFGRIDTWVNNAGLSIYGRLDKVSDEDSRRLFDTNFWGIVNGSLVALPYLLRQGGALINVGSEVSEAVVPLQGMYSASKHAVKGFTDALRIEVEHVDQSPISVTLIQPTAVNTPFPQHAKNYLQQEPKLPDPMIDPEKVADAILDAATSPTRATKVGLQAKVNTFAANNIPGIADRMAATYVDKQTKDESPRNPEGTLYIPGESGHTHGVSAGA
ncbi:MAG TPA: SDR family oxidoreductase [Tepidisphaeraceae bacterium]|jgi:short-subunit dehydrogenase|nr:SDR family oxidoreductase [Tepidisphaeraceae bacterium]